MKQILSLIVLSIVCSPLLFAQQKVSKQEAEREIRLVLQKQELAWNNFDLDEFMEGYWKSDSLLFVSSQVTKGWAVTLSNYRQKYSNQVEIGSLKFDILDVRSLTPEVYVVTGSYFLTRTTTNLGGLFTLLFQKKNGKWVIVYDHTS
jgi:uncharacterized protein (TIGR02246 family)